MFKGRKPPVTGGFRPFRDGNDCRNIGIFLGEDKFTEIKPYLRSTGGEPKYNQRLKAGYSIIKEAFTRIE